MAGDIMWFPNNNDVLKVNFSRRNDFHPEIEGYTSSHCFFTLHSLTAIKSIKNILW
jgi:hypothetical protein